VVTDETKTGATVPGSSEAEAEPAWFAEAWELAENGVSPADVAKAVGKRADDVRKLIKRKRAAIEAAAAQAELDAEPSRVSGDDPPAEPGADGNPDGPPVQATGEITPEERQRILDAAGDSSGEGREGDPQTELFPDGSVEGDGYSLRSVGKAGEPVELITVAMSGGEVPMPKGSGLLDPHKEGMLLVTYEPKDGGLPVPTREGDRGEKKIVGWKVRQTVRPIYIERVKGEEGVIEGHFAALLEAEPGRAGALLDRLIVRAGRSLQ
jgi:hypothetical protein